MSVERTKYMKLWTVSITTKGHHRDVQLNSVNGRKAIANLYRIYNNSRRFCPCKFTTRTYSRIYIRSQSRSSQRWEANDYYNQPRARFRVRAQRALPFVDHTTYTYVGDDGNPAYMRQIISRIRRIYNMPPHAWWCARDALVVTSSTEICKTGVSQQQRRRRFHQSRRVYTTKLRRAQYRPVCGMFNVTDLLLFSEQKKKQNTNVQSAARAIHYI